MSTSSTGGRAGSDPGHDRMPDGDAPDYQGGLVGHKDRALDGAGSALSGTTHEEVDRDHDDDAAIPAGSALAARRGASSARDAGVPDEALPGTATGGERASAGRSDEYRNSRDHGNRLDS